MSSLTDLPRRFLMETCPLDSVTSRSSRCSIVRRRNSVASMSSSKTLDMKSSSKRRNLDIFERRSFLRSSTMFSSMVSSIHERRGKFHRSGGKLF